MPGCSGGVFSNDDAACGTRTDELVPPLRLIRSTLVILTGIVGVSAPRVYGCDPIWLPIAHYGADTYFVVEALADTVLEVGGEPRDPTSPFERRLDRVIGRTRGGQRVRIRALPPGEARRLGLKAPMEAVMVPWAFGEDCRPIAWSETLAWMRTGTEGMVTAWPRPRDRWLDGLPTFDVEMAWREPVWRRDDSRWNREPRGGLLSPEEFMQLYEVLPHWEQLQRTPAQAAARARGWERRHPDLAGREPARTILDNLYRASAEISRPGK
jgi:hypothetical protein